MVFIFNSLFCKWREFKSEWFDKCSV